MLPGLVFVCQHLHVALRQDRPQGEPLRTCMDQDGRSTISLFPPTLLEVGKVLPVQALWCIHIIRARRTSRLKPESRARSRDHAALFGRQSGYRECRLAGVFKYHIDVHNLGPVISSDCGTEFARLFGTTWRIPACHGGICPSS